MFMDLFHDINCLALVHFCIIYIYMFFLLLLQIRLIPTWIQQGITPGSRLSHEAIGFLGFTGLEVSKLKSKLFLIEGKTKQKHVLRQIC